MQFRAGPPLYRGYMLRFWQERSQRSTQVAWRFSLDDPHTGGRRGFADLAALIAAVQCEMDAAGALTESWASISNVMEDLQMSRSFNADDEREIRAIVEQVEAGWNANSGQQFAAVFADDADYIVVDGRQIKGRAVIARGHQHIFDTIYRGSTNRATVRSIRLLREDVALVHVEWHLTFGQGDAIHEGRAINTMIITNEAGEWSIAAFQNTPLAT
ncbi:MAG: SgcJ/EcaC family oxidoreductase [Roseiflexaceae bacterium]